MKPSIVLFLILAFTLLGFSQQAQDIVFPINGEPIKNCKIINYEQENLVRYNLDGKTHSTHARAFVEKGVFVNLEAENLFYKTQKNQIPDSINNLSYENINYSSLYRTYHKATIMRNFGIGLTAGGLVSGIYGSYLIYTNESSPDTKGGLSSQEISGLGLVFLAAISGGIGIPFFTIGQIQRDKTRHKMEKCIQHQVIISTGMTNNGMGLVIKF